MSVRRALEADPQAAPAAALRWQALGARALAIIRDLYTSSEELIRLGALTAGAKLDDALAVPHLIEMTTGGGAQSRLQAIELLSGMRLNPQIDQALRALLNDSFLEVRLAAYEALVERGDPYMKRLSVDGKFVLDLIDSERPMVYITQRGEPRIVVFGADLAVELPVMMATWSNRLMINADVGDETIELYFRPVEAASGDIFQVEPTLASLIPFLAHKTTIEHPEPGLDLSYSETVGALHQIWEQGHLSADFKAEQDRIAAAILLQEHQLKPEERPDFAAPGDQWFTPGGAPAPPGEERPESAEPGG
jgi:hypothetical protein